MGFCNGKSYIKNYVVPPKNYLKSNNTILTYTKRAKSNHLCRNFYVIKFLILNFPSEAKVLEIHIYTQIPYEYTCVCVCIHIFGYNFFKMTN